MPYRPKGTRDWHFDFQIRGRRFYGSCGRDDYEEAKAIEAAERVKARSAPEVTGRFTISEALGTYWTDICQHQASARTARSQAAMVLTVLDGKMPMAELTNADVMRFVSRRRAEASNATVNRQLQLFGRALRYMVRVHGAEMPQVDLKKAETAEPEERVRELTHAEQQRLFLHLRNDLQPFVKFALMTGARLATICNLRWSDIDHDERRLLFRVKGGKQMRFPLSREIAALLSALPRSELPDHRAYVFTFEDRSRKDRQRRRIVASGGGLMEDFRQALAAAEIEDFRFHDLRHTFATRLLRQTGNLKLVSRLLGHSDVTTTTRYAHVMDQDLAAALDDFSILGRPDSQRNSRSRRK